MKEKKIKKKKFVLYVIIIKIFNYLFNIVSEKKTITEKK
jgi:hypothetical protein